MKSHLILILGPPSHQSHNLGDSLAKALSVPFFQIAKAVIDEIESQSILGKQMKRILDDSELIPDQLISELIFSLPKGEFENALILSGYPRTIQQAQKLVEERTESAPSLIGIDFEATISNLGNQNQNDRLSRNNDSSKALSDFFARENKLIKLRGHFNLEKLTIEIKDFLEQEH